MMLRDAMLSDVMLSDVMLSDVMLSDVMLSDLAVSDLMLSDLAVSDLMLSDVMWCRMMWCWLARCWAIRCWETFYRHMFPWRYRLPLKTSLHHSLGEYTSPKDCIGDVTCASLPYSLGHYCNHDSILLMRMFTVISLRQNCCQPLWPKTINATKKEWLHMRFWSKSAQVIHTTIPSSTFKYHSLSF